MVLPPADEVPSLVEVILLPATVVLLLVCDSGRVLVLLMTPDGVRRVEDETVDLLDDVFRPPEVGFVGLEVSPSVETGKEVTCVLLTILLLMGEDLGPVPCSVILEEVVDGPEVVLVKTPPSVEKGERVPLACPVPVPLRAPVPVPLSEPVPKVAPVAAWVD